ncbi:MAG TPA: alanine--tRNA ligase [Anaerolineales bacterium]|nr:alanine--tRNA ligase [Anaerolineales bacterium]
MTQKPTGAEIRQTFIDFFVEHQHTFVPSASLVPGGDATLLFTNAGMVQFKDVFLGTDKRPYTRAVDSQKVLRVAGKHNDLDEVGRDDSHHTFFEMLGNWSFGDYYKPEAITWAWQLLTDVWGLPKEKLYATCFKDDKGNIPTDDEAAEIWKQQPGMDPAHILFFGRKENFWEMAETGPCGPCSEIHIDRGEQFDNLRDQPHKCGVNGECTRFLELWNNVFIQYNRLDKDTLEPLPAKHVDTGMGFERIVSVLQGVDSNYKIDLFKGALDAVRALTGDSPEKMLANFTPYRVIADHARAAAFLIADGVVPGNVGRNYVCRMIIRRAARFGTKLGLHEPFLSNVAEAVIQAYGDFYPELVKNREGILENLRREELRFARTVESGTAYLQGMLDELKQSGRTVLDGRKAFDLYATYGLPFEIARDIAREQAMDVDEAGFRAAMEAHRLASGGGKAMGRMGGEDAEFYAGILKELQAAGKLGQDGVAYNPYEWLQVEGPLLALAADGQLLADVSAGDRVEVLLPKTGFYVESGGQVSDTGTIQARDGSWEIEVTGMRRPSAGVIVHVGELVFGHPQVGDLGIASVDAARRHDIRRNHTATHLLHAALHQVLGEKARQAGSLVAPDHFRFDFNHPEAMTDAQIERVEQAVNAAVAADYVVSAVSKSRQQAVDEGAMALFGEKYGEVVRTITIGDPHHRHSYELCGGTHLDRTSDVGAFLIVSESSAAAGVRRIEAVTGRGAYELVARRFKLLKQSAGVLKSALEEVPQKAEQLQDELVAARKQVAALKTELAMQAFSSRLSNAESIQGVHLVAMELPGLDKGTLGQLADTFREKYPEGGVCVIATLAGEQVIVMATLTQDLVKRGLKAGDLAGHVSRQLGAGGGGAPHLAFGGGRDAAKIPEALASVKAWLESKLQ